MKSTIAFIGAGNMATAIIGGLLAEGIAPELLIASDPNTDALAHLSDEYGIRTYENNDEAARQADVIVLAVKPQIMQAVLEPLAAVITHNPLIISIAAGIESASLSHWLGEQHAIVRCMPNTPAMVREGASGLFANANTSDSQRALAEHILSAVGKVAWVEDEHQMHAITAISGSAPAYFFLLMEAMIESGMKQGLSEDVAKDLALQTALGAASLASNSDITPSELRRRVTSPNGTTEAALNTLTECDFKNTVHLAMKACAERSEALGKTLKD
ncbi:pyrroline-5-carboxylate reductase [Marinibactrum halimedae]|uniref:Pyrroline-5-carboxylate reductase n=1 Tax=Marinibactrum halimedae TaxID=1444977 RepID=A0AA37TBI2_9GAMM|nr:pyrroline-5-carboxylate reductase [Marinibactrum halimedae]MCD9458317.1 pyrroline-5-carboxylate reductase [Marinibactrum halimedae]GLS27055.1 pyrroline-5-carboxylate reductase [Marinibactrum halimedae]